jgi:hypothetical protein
MKINLCHFDEQCKQIDIVVICQLSFYTPKTNLEIPKGYPDSVYGRIDNTMTKGKTIKGQTMICKTLHRKLKMCIYCLKVIKLIRYHEFPCGSSGHVVDKNLHL